MTQHNEKYNLPAEESNILYSKPCFLFSKTSQFHSNDNICPRNKTTFNQESTASQFNLNNHSFNSNSQYIESKRKSSSQDFHQYFRSKKTQNCLESNKNDYIFKTPILKFKIYTKSLFHVKEEEISNNLTIENIKEFQNPLCQKEIFKDTLEEQIELNHNDSSDENNIENKLINNFFKNFHDYLFQSIPFDTTLLLDNGEKINAHKIILINSSTYFKRKIDELSININLNKNSTFENKNRLGSGTGGDNSDISSNNGKNFYIIKITEVLDIKNLQTCVDFLYSGGTELNCSNDQLGDLYKLARKLEINDLMRLCVILQNKACHYKEDLSKPKAKDQKETFGQKVWSVSNNELIIENTKCENQFSNIKTEYYNQNISENKELENLKPLSYHDEKTKSSQFKFSLGNLPYNFDNLPLTNEQGSQIQKCNSHTKEIQNKYINYTKTHLDNQKYFSHEYNKTSTNTEPIQAMTNIVVKQENNYEETSVNNNNNNFQNHIPIDENRSNVINNFNNFSEKNSKNSNVVLDLNKFNENGGALFENSQIRNKISNYLDLVFSNSKYFKSNILTNMNGFIEIDTISRDFSIKDKYIYPTTLNNSKVSEILNCYLENFYFVSIQSSEENEMANIANSNEASNQFLRDSLIVFCLGFGEDRSLKLNNFLINCKLNFTDINILKENLRKNIKLFLCQIFPSISPKITYEMVNKNLNLVINRVCYLKKPSNCKNIRLEQIKSSTDCFRAIVEYSRANNKKEKPCVFLTTHASVQIN